MPSRPKMPSVTDDNRTFSRLTRVEGDVKALKAEVAANKAHLLAHDRELHEVDLDIAALTDMIVSAGQIALRAHQRDRARLISRRRRARRG